MGVPMSHGSGIWSSFVHALFPPEAVANVRDAVELSTGSDLLNMRADALLDLALVLDATADRAGARETADAALALYRAKGNVVSAERAERLLSSWT